MQQRGLTSAGYIAQGIIAGLVGGVALAAFLVPVDVFLMHSTTFDYFFQFIAAGAIGRTAAFASTSTVWLGIALHFAIAASWGVGYAYIEDRTPQVAARPLVSGLVFGFTIYFLMQLIEVIPPGLYHLPTPRSLGVDLIGHCIFFGLPIAYTLRALGRRPSRTAAS